MKTLAALLALALAAGPSFDEAKADKAKRADYLKDAVAKLPLKGAYLLGDEAANKAGMDALRAEYKEDGRAVFFNKEIKKVLAPADAPTVRAVVYFREGVDVGAAQKAGILLVGDLFALASEDEAKSVLEDYVATFVKYGESCIKIGDKEVDTLVPALKEYLTTYRQFIADLAKQKKIYDDNNENTLQKEIWDSLEMVKTHLADTLGKAGLEHVPAADGEFQLKKK